MRRMSEPVSRDYYQVAPLTGRLRVVVAIGIGVALAVGVVLRFWTPSALWLDEALTVNIAGLPLHEIPSHLKQDGAPPLFYYLLHFWMLVFGHSDVAVRSLSGVIGVATIPVAYFVGRRLGGKMVGWSAAVLFACAPFAVYYSTEARMYALVMLLTGLGMLALQRARTQPRPGNLIAIAVVTAALLYSQYWCVYLVAVVGAWLLVSILWTRYRHHDSTEWRRSVPSLIAVAVGSLAFVPWIPTFLYQSKHTGTPWATPTNFAGIVDALTGFTFNQGSLSTISTNQGRLLTLIYFALAALALFGVGISGRLVELDLHTRPAGRGIGIVTFATLFAAIAGGLVTSSAFSSRYASVIFFPFMLLVALGTATLLNAPGRVIFLSIAVATSLFISVQSVHSQRTQAPKVAAVLKAEAKPGDIVAFCPDQLGPATYRVVSDPAQYKMVTFPRGIGPQFVDWVDYADAVNAAQPTKFAEKLEEAAGTKHRIWLVWQPGYMTFGNKCETLASLLGEGATATNQKVIGDPMTYYEPMNLSEYSSSPG